MPRSDCPKFPNLPRSIAATGSFDYTIRLWNVDDAEGENVSETTSRCISVLNHGSPVQCVLFMQSSNQEVPMWLISAGGTTVRVWNPVTSL
jgi:WD40 repeat protein